MATDLIERARAGDNEAFGELVARYRRELHVHCYRILGSTQDAEDALQETLLAAWQGLDGYEGRASLRTWLYRVATSRCLNARRSNRRRPLTTAPAFDVEPPEPTRFGEVVWLDPYPDALLETLGDGAPGPEARYESREAMSLAFITALQLLPPRQRAVLVLRDVLGFPAADVAQILESTQESVTSALKRARTTLERRRPDRGGEAPPAAHSADEQEIVDRLTQAYEMGDLDGVVALLTDDVVVAMPPVPFEYVGRDVAERFMGTMAFRDGRTFRLIATRANSEPAFGVYVRTPGAEVFQAHGLLVISLAGDRIRQMTRFDNIVLPGFGLPLTLPD
ncbi:MAG TPA: RNA polymerase subunit sigma-70 [Acidimicrobiales bacterium]